MVFLGFGEGSFNGFLAQLSRRAWTATNYRGGRYTIGRYTVSAHVPMGAHVAATPDGRRSGEPLAGNKYPMVGRSFAGDGLRAFSFTEFARLQQLVDGIGR